MKGEGLDEGLKSPCTYKQAAGRRTQQARAPWGYRVWARVQPRSLASASAGKCKRQRLHIPSLALALWNSGYPTPDL